MVKKKKKELTEKEWKKQLSPESYKVLREKEAEAPFSGKYWECTDAGTYCCAGCGAPLFSSEAKYDAGIGLPTFSAPLHPESLAYQEAAGFFTKRTEVSCKGCGGHLGHVFNDGPKPEGKRYTIDSAALNFKKE